jgi:hypothetical protein
MIYDNILLISSLIRGLFAFLYKVSVYYILFFFVIYKCDIFPNILLSLNVYYDYMIGNNYYLFTE